MKVIRLTNFNKNPAVLLGLICFITNISQLPFFLSNDIVKSLVIVFWFALLSYVLLTQNGVISKRIIPFFITLFVFDMFLLIVQLFSYNEYINSSFIYPVHLSIFVLTVSFFVGQLSNESDIQKITNNYIYSALIVGIVIYFENFRNVDWSNSMSYLYTSKNSIAQIFLIAVILSLFYFKKKQIVLKCGMIAFFVLLLLMLKSRTNLIGLLLVTIYYGLFVINVRGKKLIYLFGLLMIAITILYNDTLYDLLINKVLLNNRIGSDFDTITSGRIGHLETFMDNFKYNSMIGYGDYYLESFPLAALMSYGILGAIPIFILSILPLIVSLNRRIQDDLFNIKKLTFILAVVILTNGLFEQLSPFGPGVKNYMLWLVCGFYIGLSSNKANNTE